MKPSLLILALLLITGCPDLSGSGGTTVGSAAATTGATGGGGTGAGATGGNGGRGGTGGMAGVGGMGVGGMGGIDTCIDQGVGESNDTMATATLIAGGTDCDDLSTQGTIDGRGDADWYMYVQTGDEFGCVVEPGRDWAVQSGHTLRVCKYVECRMEMMTPDTVNCKDGSTDDMMGGLKGCCGTVPFDVGIGTFGCDGGDDLLNIYTRVEEPDAPLDACTNYNLNYTF